MFDSIIKLIGVQKTVNQYGDTVETETERTVFAEPKSISQTEFYQAEALGFKPEIKFILADYLDYQNETKLKYKAFAGVEEVYTIIRTYRSGTSMELTCKRGID